MFTNLISVIRRNDDPAVARKVEASDGKFIVYILSIDKCLLDQDFHLLAGQYVESLWARIVTSYVMHFSKGKMDSRLFAFVM